MSHQGHHTLVQDLGRPGYRALGVPLGGAFDRKSLMLANALLGNRLEAPVLEMTLFGGTYQAIDRTGVAIAGASMAGAIQKHNGSSIAIEPPRSFSLEPGDILNIGGARQGVRMYLAVVGGFHPLPVLGSCSRETPIATADVLSCSPSSTPGRWTSIDLDKNANIDRPLRVIDGPDASLINESEMCSLIEREWRVDIRSDRVGIRLAGDVPTIDLDPDRLSIPVWPGAIELTRSELIILGPAGGTMGGYSVVANVISADLDRLAWLRPGQSVRFERVGLDQARRLDHDDRQGWSEALCRISSVTGACPWRTPVSPFRGS